MMSENNLAFNDDDFQAPQGLSSHGITTYPGASTSTERDTFSGAWTSPQAHNVGGIFVTINRENVPEWFENTKEKLERIFNLPENWDSYGARQIAIGSALGTIELILYLLEKNIPEPSVVPINTGGVQIEWHMKNIDFEIEIQPEGIFDIYMEDLSNEFDEIDLEFEKPEFRSDIEFNDVVDLFMEKINQR